MNDIVSQLVGNPAQRRSSLLAELNPVAAACKLDEPKREATSAKSPERPCTPNEFQRLLHVAERVTGSFGCGLSRRAFWKALLRLGWDTGLRMNHLLRLRYADLAGSHLHFARPKTGRVIKCQLSEATVQCLQAV